MFQPSVWDDDMDMVQLRMHFTEVMREIWDKGIKSFVAGDWSTASIQFKEILRLTDGMDGPSQHLMSQMEHYSYKVPVDWQGFTELE